MDLQEGHDISVVYVRQNPPETRKTSNGSRFATRETEAHSIPWRLSEASKGREQTKMNNIMGPDSHRSSEKTPWTRAVQLATPSHGALWHC